MPRVTHASKPIIGIAGGIGAGKSAVARLLAEQGCVVSESDDLARQALRQPEIRDEVARWWGPAMLDAQGEVDRSAVAKIVFSKPLERRRLEALTHPWIEARRRERFAAAPPEAPAMVIDAPLLFEAGLDAECDAVIFVDADRAVRADRVASSRGWPPSELARREASQMSLDEKRRRADYIVQNNGDWSQLQSQVVRVLHHIVETNRRS